MAPQLRTFATKKLSIWHIQGELRKRMCRDLRRAVRAGEHQALVVHRERRVGEGEHPG